MRETHINVLVHKSRFLIDKHGCSSMVLSLRTSDHKKNRLGISKKKNKYHHSDQVMLSVIGVHEPNRELNETWLYLAGRIAKFDHE